MKPLFTCIWVSILWLALGTDLRSQQIADTTYQPVLLHPAYAQGKGPVVFVDEGHFNFHTKNGRYRAFSELLERDGYRVLAYTGTFEKKELNKGKILVISNALNEINVTDWYLPTPSAFTEKEIKVLNRWVKKGGNLFLIADHMPLAGAARDLAASFGFGFSNGFAMDTLNRGPAFFRIQDHTLHESPVTRGRDSTETVDQVVSFTGQAFTIPKEATPVLTFGPNFISLMPDTAWVFDDNTRTESVEGWSQGAFMPYGKGRVVAFGEAAMFTAQLAGPQKIKMGMNNDIAPENYQLLLNLIHWLDGKLDQDD